jgi:peroxiredoxin
VREIIPELERLGIAVVGVIGQKATRVAGYLREHPLPFPILVDRDRAVIKSYGVYHRVGLDAWNIARPAIFLLDRSGVVRYGFIGRHQADLAPLDDLWIHAKAAATDGDANEGSGTARA